MIHPPSVTVSADGTTAYVGNLDGTVAVLNTTTATTTITTHITTAAPINDTALST